MADVIEVIAKFRDEASRELEKFGTSLQNLARTGIEPISRLSPTAGAALEGFITKLGPTGVAISAIAGATVGAVAGLTSLVKSVADTADELRDMSQVTGASVESLSALALAAEKSGSSVEEVAGSFRMMQRAIGEATEGSKEANEALNKLGLSAQELKGLTPEAQFESLARAISNIEDPTERARQAMAIFGKAGTDLLPVLNEVAEQGMAGVIERGRELGIVVSTETANAADEFNDSLAELSAVGRGLAVSLGSALLPMFVDIAKTVLEAVVAISKFLRETGLLTGVANLVRVALSPVIEIIRAMAAGLIATSQALRGDFAGALETLKKGAMTFGDAVVEAFTGTTEASQTTTEAVTQHTKTMVSGFQGTAVASETSTQAITQNAKTASDALTGLAEKQAAAAAQIGEAVRSAAMARAQAEAEAKGDRTQLVQLELSERIAAIRQEEEQRLASLRTLGLAEAQEAELRRQTQQASLDAVTAANQQAVTQWLEIERSRAEAVRQVDAEIRASREETATTLAAIAAASVGNTTAALEAEHQATLDAIARQREARIAAADAIVGDAELAAQKRVAAEEAAFNQIAVAEAQLAQERQQIVRGSTEELIRIVQSLGTAYAEELKPLQMMGVTENLNKQLSMLDAAYKSGLLSVNAYAAATAQAQSAADAAATTILYGLSPAIDSTVQTFEASSDAAVTWQGALTGSASALGAVQASADMASASVSRLNTAMATAVAPDLQATAEAALASSTATRPYAGDVKGKAVYIPEGMFHIQHDIRGRMFDLPTQFNFGTNRPDIYGNAPWSMPQPLKQYAPMMYGDPTLGKGWYRFQGGGTVPGPMGQRTMAMVEAGEQILPIGATGGGAAAMTIHFHFEREVFLDTDQRMDQLAQSVWDRVKDRHRRLLTR